MRTTTQFEDTLSFVNKLYNRQLTIREYIFGLLRTESDACILDALLPEARQATTALSRLESLQRILQENRFSALPDDRLNELNTAITDRLRAMERKHNQQEYPVTSRLAICHEEFEMMQALFAERDHHTAVELL